MFVRRPLMILVVGLVACSNGATPGSGSTTNPTEPPTSAANTTSSSEAIPTPTTEFSEPGALLVVGDWGSGTAPQGAVAGAMERITDELEIEAILTAGDNLYSDDAEFLLHPFDWVSMAEIPYWITWGNHDIETSRREDLVDEAFDSPPKWTTHSWGAVSIVILDSNQISDPGQIAYLQGELERIEGPTIVVFHHPAYSCSRHGDNVEVQEEWVALFDDDVVLVLAGHDHNYQRIEKEGRTYLVTGGGGRHLYEIEACDHDMASSAQLHHFVALQLLPNAIWGTAIDVNGAPFDEFFIEFEPGVLP